MTRLPDDEVAFFFAAAKQLPPPERLLFQDRVHASLQARSDFGPGDFDRAIRQAFGDLWTPPAIEERPARWDRDRPSYERVSKRAREVPA